MRTGIDRAPCAQPTALQAPICRTGIPFPTDIRRRQALRMRGILKKRSGSISSNQERNRVPIIRHRDLFDANVNLGCAIRFPRSGGLRIQFVSAVGMIPTVARDAALRFDYSADQSRLRKVLELLAIDISTDCVPSRSGRHCEVPSAVERGL